MFQRFIFIGQAVFFFAPGFALLAGKYRLACAQARSTGAGVFAGTASAGAAGLRRQGGFPGS